MLRNIALTVIMTALFPVIAIVAIYAAAFSAAGALTLAAGLTGYGWTLDVLRDFWTLDLARAVISLIV